MKDPSKKIEPDFRRDLRGWLDRLCPLPENWVSLGLRAQGRNLDRIITAGYSPTATVRVECCFVDAESKSSTASRRSSGSAGFSTNSR